MGTTAANVLFSTVRRKVLTALLLHTQGSWYLSELARHVGAASSHLHRELGTLVAAGIVTRRVEGRQTYFQADARCPFLPELTGLLRKLVGAPAVLEKSLAGLRPKIRVAFIYGSVARRTEQAHSDVDLLVVGTVAVADLVPALQTAERTLGRPVNPTVYPAAELAKKFRGGHHFVRSIVPDSEKIFVIGSQHELEAIAGATARQTASYQPRRASRIARGRGGKT